MDDAGQNNFVFKDPAKGKAVDNYRPVSRLFLMSTRLVSENFYNFLDINNLLLEEQKRSRKGSRGTKAQLLNYKMILQDCKKRQKVINSLGGIQESLRHGSTQLDNIECLDLLKIADKF